MLIGDRGGGIGVEPGELDTIAGTLRCMSQDVGGVTSGLVNALAAAENAVGDPGAAGALGGLIQAWMGPIGLLGPLLDELANSLSGSAQVYSTTDAAIARHAR